MQILRILAIVSFVAGAALLAFGFVRSGGDGDPSPADFDTTRFVAPPFPTASPTEALGTRTAAAPSPTPFDGAVARLKIPRFKVDSAIEAIGITSNELETPKNPRNTGWYDIYDKPGFYGNAVFSAHVDYYPNILGPFNKLSKLEAGDEIVVQMENGLEYRYRVIRKARYDVSNIPMGDLIWPKDKPRDQEWVTLITCGGRFQASRPGGPGEYLDRDVVVAERYQ